MRKDDLIGLKGSSSFRAPLLSAAVSCTPPKRLRVRVPLLAAVLISAPAAGAPKWLTQITNAPDANCRAVEAVSKEVVWVGCSSGTVLRTSNGGKTWLRFKVPDASSSLEFRGIAAFDAQAAIALSAGEATEGKAVLYRTEDGGRSWSQVFSSREPGVFLDAIKFWDRRRGLVLGDPVRGKWFGLSTDDGGRSWQPIDSRRWPQTLTGEAAFAASNSALFTMKPGYAWIGSGVGPRARVFRTNDFGRTWQVADTPLPSSSSSGIFSVNFLNPKIGLAVGGDLNDRNKPAPNVIATRDGGRSWQLAAVTNPPGLMEAVVIFDRRSVLAAGVAGSSVSYDLGRTWQQLADQPLHALSCVTGQCWGVGDKGLVVRIAPQRQRTIGTNR
jgi:photosystem II stability/assembly factor-like uncharacterized protein